MNKYELAVVVSAKIEDDARTAVIEKVKKTIEKHGGQITNVDDWGKKKLAYEIEKMTEGFYYFIQFDGECTSWTAGSVIFRSKTIRSIMARGLCQPTVRYTIIRIKLHILTNMA